MTELVMAVSRSDDSCEAPKDFQLSSTEGSESRFSGSHRKCFLCLNFRKVFYCKQCIRNGDFVHSTSHFSERFADKQLRLIRIKSNCKYVEEHCEAFLQKRSKKDNIVIEINKCKEKVALLKLAIQQKRDNAKVNTAKLKSLTDFNNDVVLKLPKYKANFEKLCKHTYHKKTLLERHGSHIEIEQESLKVLRRQRLKQLVDYVFPIKEIQNTQGGTGYGSAGCTERALAEASRPARGSAGAPGPAPLQVLSASLPIDGDCSAYCHWVAANKGPTSTTAVNPEPVNQNPAYRISAALAYSAQLLKIAAFYLDVKLPFNVSYSDFCSSELEERRFKRQVWRLQGCAAVLVAATGVGAVRGMPLTSHREPPLHTLLRACPLQLDSVQGEDIYQHSLEEEEDDGVARGLWWGGESEEVLLLGASDDEEPEPPEHITWDWETLGDTGQAAVARGQLVAGSPAQVGAGLMTSAAASIVSIWRGWTK